MSQVPTLRVPSLVVHYYRLTAESFDSEALGMAQALAVLPNTFNGSATWYFGSKPAPPIIPGVVSTEVGSSDCERSY